jgi:hypothetical protein
MNENKFEHSGQIPIGCNSGDHLWDDREGKLGIEADGDLTKIKAKCIRCGQQFDMSVPLDLNQFLPQTSAPVQPNRVTIERFSVEPRPIRQTQEDKDIVGQSDILRRLLG